MLKKCDFFCFVIIDVVVNDVLIAFASTKKILCNAIIYSISSKKVIKTFSFLILSLLYLLLIKKRNHAQRFKKKRSFIISRKTKTR